MHVGGRHINPIGVLFQRLGIYPPGEVQLVGKPDYPITPWRILFHDHVGADRPMVFAIAVVVEVGAAKI